MNDMIYKTNKDTHYPLTLNAVYTCCTRHSFWYYDAGAEVRKDYPPQMGIEDALSQFCQEMLGMGGKLMLGTDPVTARKMREAFGGKISKERKISLAQRVIELEPLPVCDTAVDTAA
jgi:hypothetical protein